MKSFFSAPALALSATALLLQPMSAEIRKAPTADEISAKRRQVDSVYGINGAKAVEEEVKIVDSRRNLLASSEYLVGPHGFILVPKGAVIAQGKMVTVSATIPANAQFLNWNDFIRKHRAGIRLLEISEKQWMGESSLESLLPKLEAAQKGSFTTLTSLNGSVVSLPAIQKLLSPES